MEPAWASRLLDDNGLQLENWLKDGRADIIKTGPHRTVYKVQMPYGNFYLKHYKTPGWQSRLQNLFRPCKAKLEWNAAEKIRLAGIPTITPVAVGRTFYGPFVADSFLVTPEIPQTVSLHDYILEVASRDDAKLSIAFRRGLADQLGKLVGRLHGHGLIHRDLHAGNILIKTPAKDNITSQPEYHQLKLPCFQEGTQPSLPRLWLIDLHAVHTSRRLSISQMERNLGLLANFFSHFAQASDRLRFFRAYWKAVCETVPAGNDSASTDKDSDFTQLSDFPLNFIHTLKRVEAFCEQSVRLAHEAADRKWLRANRRLIIADTAKTACRGLAELGVERLHAWRDRPEFLFNDELIRQWHVRESNRQQATIGSPIGTIESLHVESRLIAGKEHALQPRNSREWTPARRAWEMGHALLRRGFQVPRPLAFISTLEQPGKLREYLITENLTASDTVSFTKFLKRSSENSADSQWERLLSRGIELFARQLWKLHEYGFLHTELTGDSVFLERPQDAKEPVAPLTKQRFANVIFGALQGIQRRRRITQKDVAHVLANLFQSLASGSIRRSHCVRFLRAFEKQKERTDWKSLWRFVETLLPSGCQKTRVST
ncbi:MAG: hypothetical protein Tsb009_19760 [Planctomycetaceae bacterium]